MPERGIIWGSRVRRPSNVTNPSWWWCREHGGDIGPGQMTVLGTPSHGGDAVPYCVPCHDGIVAETVVTAKE